MSKVVLDITVSLDGFIAPPTDDLTRLHEWLFNGDTPSKYNDFFKLSEESAKVFDELVRTTGSEGKVPPRPPFCPPRPSYLRTRLLGLVVERNDARTERLGF